MSCLTDLIFLLKGLIFCHECGYPLATINRRPASGEDRLFFVCRTYQRFTKAGVCSCHSIKEKDVTDAVIAKTKEICAAYLNPDELLPVAQQTLEEAQQADSADTEIRSLQSKIESMTANLDKMYMDKLAGILTETDFMRIYQKIKFDRAQLEEKLKVLLEQRQEPIKADEQARKYVQDFLESGVASREMLVSLIERVELSEDKQVYIKYRFKALDDLLIKSSS